MNTHKERMKARRVRQLARTPGFTPVPNRRIDAKISVIEATLAAAGATDPYNIRRQAERTVAATLPPVPIGVRTRPWGSRSKY